MHLRSKKCHVWVFENGIICIFEENALRFQILSAMFPQKKKIETKCIDEVGIFFLLSKLIMFLLWKTKKMLQIEFVESHYPILAFITYNSKFLTLISDF